MFTCHHCIKTFGNSQDLEKHKQRKTSCLSWNQVENKLVYVFQQLENEKKKKRELEAKQDQMQQLFSNIQQLKSTIAHKDAVNLQREQQIHRLQALQDRNHSLLQEKDNIIRQKNAALQQITCDEETQAILSHFMEQVQSNDPFWNDIIIEAKDMSKKTRASIKKLVYHIPCKKKVIDIIESTHPSISVIDVKVDALCFVINICLRKKDENVCCICFERQVSQTIICHTCSQSNICKHCELMQMQKYNRCAFCNTSYEQSSN